MRQFYVEHDLVSAEVQAFFQDGSMSLHTRSLKYGKLQGGVLIVVAPSLMKRLKQHFHRFDFGVDVIFGMIGYVWVSPSPEGAALQPDDGGAMLNDVAVGAAATPADAPTRAPTPEDHTESNFLFLSRKLSDSGHFGVTFSLPDTHARPRDPDACHIRVPRPVDP